MSNEYTDFTKIKSSGAFLIVKARKEDKWVILKGLKEEFRNSPRNQNQLKKEFKIGNELDHQNIVKYLDFIETEEFGKCIVEEYIEGRSLKEYLQEFHSEEELLDIIEQIAGALSYIHGKHFCHNNLTPKNILITKNGNQVKLIDFRPEFFQDSKETAGTLKYLSPELKDGTVQPDGRSDIFSLGVIMREMNLPLTYEPVIKKCAGYGRNDRYADTDELLEALEHGERSEGSHKSLIAIIVIAIAAAIIAFVIFSNTDSTESAPATTETTTDSTQVAPVEESTENPGTETAAPKDTSTDLPSDATETSGDKMAFLNDMKPALYKDLDKIFQPYLDGTKTSGLAKEIKGYYRGLMKAQSGLDAEQRSALDKVFGEYVAKKKAQLGE